MLGSRTKKNYQQTHSWVSVAGMRDWAARDSLDGRETVAAQSSFPAMLTQVGPTVARSGRFRADLRQCGRATLVRATKWWQAPWLPVSISRAPSLLVAVRSGRSNAGASRNVGGVAPGEQTLGGSCAFHVRRLWSSTARWDEGPAKSSSAPTAARCSRRSTAPHSSVVPDSSNNVPPDCTCCGKARCHPR